jgi:uncharacterized membrane protein YkvA (DUF1232 family)
MLWFALRHPGRPAWLLPAAIVLGVFALDPLNLELPFLGFLDDLVLLPLLLHWLLKLLPENVRSGFDRRALLPRTM